MANKIKSFKRLFIKKGKMMNIFDYINWLHRIGDYSGISRMASQLNSDLPPYWTPRHHKYLELIHYCIFLESYQEKLDDEEGAMLAKELINILDIGHEVGRAIERRVNHIIHS
jgi:hypothetical protein